MPSASEVIAKWVGESCFDTIPVDVLSATKYRILDVIGLIMAGHNTPFGRSLCQAITATGRSGKCSVVGLPGPVDVLTAAFANGALAGALEYDDTHNESIVHMSSPSVAAAMAISQLKCVSGADLLAAIALGSEVSCRIGSVAPGQFHKRGFQPTALFATFGSAYLAGHLFQLNADHMRCAAGIAGSYAAGLLECYSDGTQSKYLHQGLAARNGIESAILARAGVTGPRTIFEGRFGLFSSHLQVSNDKYDVRIALDGLGSNWYSRNSSFKPYPAAHIIHPYIDALLRLRVKPWFRVEDVKSIHCIVAPFNVSIVCEPVGEKKRPASDSQGRLSLQYTLAEALVNGRMGVDAYQADSLTNPVILEIANRVTYEVDESFPGPERFMAKLEVTMNDGRVDKLCEANNRGSPSNPMTREEILAKFRENSSGVLGLSAQDTVVATVDRLEELPDASALLTICATQASGPGIGKHPLE